jgi:chemotaxis response regulator CheB
VTDQLRVALLARAGAARDQLRKALEEAGAVIVAEGDPGELDPKDVKEKLPKVYLVGLEPATEKAIDRFDALFGEEGIEVMFDDAEVTAKLDGWDLNRWARHLAGKLTGSAMLPPVPAGAPAIGEFVEEAHDAGAMLQPGLPATPAEQMAGAKLEDYTSESPELAEWVPTSPSLTSAPKAEAEAQPDEGFSWDGSQSAAGGGDDGKEFKLDTDLGIDVDLASLDFAPTPDASPGTAAGDYGAVEIADMPELPSGEGLRFSSLEGDGGEESSGDLDADVAALAAQLEAFERSDSRGAAVEPEFARAKSKEDEAIDAAATRVMPAISAKPVEPVAPKSAASAATSSPSGKGRFDFSNLSLSAMDGETELANSPPIEAKFGTASDPAPSKASGFGDLSLEGDEPATAAGAKPTAPAAAPGRQSAGAVLILAGLGGPDAVRQLLSTLPDRLSVPVLLYQHLEVGKHERLVEQLAKISKLPVLLAKEGDAPASGKVSLLPSGVTAVANGGALKFAPGNLSQLLSALPPADSMVIVLSGADAQLVPMILAVKDGGGIVLAQDPEVCFDAAAAEAMRKEGAAVYPALGLAKQVAARWSA